MNAQIQHLSKASVSSDHREDHKTTFGSVWC